jgi:4-amino-4-deoxy-L-arabinose transferase-like glycosyltransferase
VALLLHSHAFSLPYIDHPDEPAFYLAGQVWIGAFDMGSYMRGYPPAYIALELLVSQLLRLFGFPEISQTINVMRWIAIAISAGTLWLIFSAAREAAGDWASLVAGVAWITSPFVVSNGVYAAPDPFVYFTVVCALWLSILAIRREQSRYAIAAMVVGAAAVLIKLMVVPALIAGVTALFFWLRDKQVGSQTLVRQIDIVAVTAFLVLGVFRTDSLLTPYSDSLPESEIGIIRSEGAQSMLFNLVNAERISNNISYVFVPVSVHAALLWLFSGAVAWLLARSARIDWRLIVLCLIAVLAVPWIMASFTEIALHRVRDVLPATTALCVLIGIAAAQIWRALPNKRVLGWLYGAAVAAWLVFAILPNLNAALAIVHERGFPDRRVEVRRWADATLEDGWIAVPYDYEKVFNSLWGGIPSGRWFDYLVYEGEFTDKPLSYWRDERGMLHAVVSLETAQRPENQAYFAQLLPLKTFANPPYQHGTEVIVYRTIPIQTPLEATFGDQIKLIGMDFELSAESARLRLYWQPLRPLQSNYSLYLHLTPLDSRQILAQQDGAPKAKRPTAAWQDANEILVGDWFTVSLPEACDVRLTAGLYDPITGVRLLLPDGSDFIELWRKPCP